LAQPSLIFVVPGRLETRTGGYEYDRRIIDGLRARGWSIQVRELDDSFPQATAAAFAQAEQVLSTIEDGTLVVVDGLAFGAMPAQIEHHASRLSFVPIVHALLASEVGIDASTAGRYEISERKALAWASRIVAAGRALIEPLARYGVAHDRIAVVEPGTDRVPVARGSRDSDVLHLVTVATLNPGKGHDVLFRALATLTGHRWRLTCAGSSTRDSRTAARLRSMLMELRLGDRVALAGELDAAAMVALYDRADVFVLPTLSETHPLSVVEALARGLPVVSTTTGAIPDLVCGSDTAGLLVEPGDADGLAAALAQVLGDARCRQRLADGARRVRERLPTWDDAATKMEAALWHGMARPRSHEDTKNISSWFKGGK
jgi:glycosyltransferase involved in cell wall biosynthesis